MPALSLDFRAGWVPLACEPGDTVAPAITVPTEFAAGTWKAYIWRDDRKTTLLATASVSVVGLVVTPTWLGTATAALVPAGTNRFSGFWELISNEGLSSQRTVVKGDFLVGPRGRAATNATAAITVTISNDTLTITSTAGGGGGGSMTGSAILAALAPVDGTGSGLDADKLDGQHASAFQLVNTDLTVIAGLAPSNDDVLQRKAGAWTNRTPAQLKTDLGVAADITAAVNALVAGAPGALDTLNELATALNNDASFAATITTALAGKQPLDTDLTTIAGLSPGASDFLQFTGGAWANRTPAQARTALAATTKYAALIGDGTSTTLTVTHNLNTADVTPRLRDASTGAEITANWTTVDANTITAGPFLTAPANLSLKVVVVG
jgi:hypothetical protein